MRQFLKTSPKPGTKPEFEIYDMGMINNLAYLIRTGIVKTPVYLQFRHGYSWGDPGHPGEPGLPAGHGPAARSATSSSPCARGATCSFPMCTQSLIMGGNARVGLEDNLYLKRACWPRAMPSR